MDGRWVKLVAPALIVLLAAGSVAAQGSSTASITGVIVDSDGSIVPGADVVVKNLGTAETFRTVSSSQGVFAVPALITGTYSVTVSLQGFKTALINNVVVNAGVPASVRAMLEVGGLTEEVVVRARS